MSGYWTDKGRQMVIRWLEDKLRFLQDHKIPAMSFTQSDIADILESLRGTK